MSNPNHLPEDPFKSDEPAKSLEDITSEAESGIAKMLRLLKGGKAAHSIQEENGARLDSLHQMSINGPGSSARNFEQQQDLPANHELDPSAQAVSALQSAVNYQEPSFSGKLVSDIHIEELVELLQNGNIREFNAKRPSAGFAIPGVQLRNLDLQGVDLRAVDLTRANFSGSNLTGALFQRACLDHANMSKTLLNNCKFFGASLRYTDLTAVTEAKQAEFQECNMGCADLSGGANFSGAYFNAVRLIKATLTDSNFSHCQFVSAYLASSTLTNANFEKANLHKARLFQANGLDVNFDSANLTGAEAIQSHFTSSNRKLSGDKISKTNFDNAWIMGFKHNGAIKEELFEKAISDRLPPEGQFISNHQVDQGKLLINGIPGTDKVLYDSALEELDSLIGLDDVKLQIRELSAFVEANQERLKMDLPPFKCILHRVYLGEPGTGKTTVARIEAKLYYALGLLQKGHVVETDKSGFIAGYSGQSLAKSHETIDSALGGTLIADEIYALTETKNDDYAKDAMAVIVKRLWDDRDKFCCIFLGYGDEMEAFMNTNKGMKRRIGAVIHFPSYSTGELIDIFKQKMDKFKLNYTPAMLAEASVLFAAIKQKDGKNFGNAGTVENTVEQLTQRLSNRLKKEGIIKNEDAQRNPKEEDLPFLKMSSFRRSSFPALKELVWVDKEGNPVAFDKLRTTGRFPDLSPESLELIKSFVEKELLERKTKKD